MIEKGCLYFFGQPFFWFNRKLFPGDKSQYQTMITSAGHISQQYSSIFQQDIFGRFF
jgi:hypothetical protein